MQLETWYKDQTMIRNLSDITILGNDVLIELYSITHAAKSALTTVEGELMSEKYGKEVYNLAKVISIGSDSKLQIKVGDLVSLPDEMFEPIPDGSRGFTNEGIPKAGYIALGKLIPFVYISNKLSNKPKNDLLFIIPSTWIKVKYNGISIFNKEQD